MATALMSSVAEIFERSLSAHLPPERFAKLQATTVLVAGLGGGSNIAEVLARKGIGRLVIADPDVFEPHNVRQRGSTASSWGTAKVHAMRARLLDTNPHLDVVGIEEGVTLANIAGLVRASDYVLDMLDFHAFREKLALYDEARRCGKVVITAPSVVNGAALYVFAPDGVEFARVFGLDQDLPMAELAMQFIERLIPHFPAEAPLEMYRAAARGERTLPLDAVGVDQAAVLATAAIENLVLGRVERVVFAPRGIAIDASDPRWLARIVELDSPR